MRLFNQNFGPSSLYSTLTLNNEYEVHTFQEARRLRDNYTRRLMYHFPGARILIVPAFSVVVGSAPAALFAAGILFPSFYNAILAHIWIRAIFAKVQPVHVRPPLRDLGYSPYVMIYNKGQAPQEVRYLQRWCNNRLIFKAQPDSWHIYGSGQYSQRSSPSMFARRIMASRSGTLIWRFGWISSTTLAR